MFIAGVFLNTTCAFISWFMVTCMTSNKQTVSCQMSQEGNICKSKQHFWRHSVTEHCCLLAHVLRPWQKVMWLWWNWCLPQLLGTFCKLCFFFHHKEHYIANQLMILWETVNFVSLKSECFLRPTSRFSGKKIYCFHTGPVIKY